MLVISRKAGQSVMIGENVTVKVVEVRGQQVRLGIEAPAEISVAREELHREVAAANKQAVRTRKENIAAVASLLRNQAERGREER
jgi:carbon storage regulator